MIMSDGTLTVLIGGEAGQGLVTIGDLLVKSLVRAGYRFVVTQDYQSRIRGGHNAYVLRIDAGEVLGPDEKVDLLVALNPETIDLHQGRFSAKGLILTDEAFGSSPEGALAVPYKDMAEGRTYNVAALGAAGAVLGLEKDILATALDRAFGKKHPEVAEKNIQTLEKAYDWAAKNGPDRLRLPAAPGDSGRLAMNGNQAIALGAMAAGVKFCAFYPMTPSTSVALTLAGQAEKMGLVVEQAEDEIAAVNMVLGASYAGAPSLVTTSGGGLALMVEGLSLAGIIETPLVVVLVQRPGPATGLPTRTEQGDLEFVIFAGHGEFPRVVFAPGTIEDCFHLTRRAFDFTEKYQTPAFVLSDQFLADSFRAIEPFDLESGPIVNPGAAHDALVKEMAGEEYKRYALTESGVSPRLLPGRSKHLVVADSDEHTEDGHLTEDLDVRILMNNKRLRKMDVLRQDVVPPSYFGDDYPDLLLVCWGSSQGPVLEAAQKLQAKGIRAGCLHFSQVWPLITEHFLHRLESAGRVVCVEGNAVGQLAKLIRRETGFSINELVTRYDGLPFTSEYILKKLGREAD